MSEWRARLSGQIDDLRFLSILFADGELAVLEEDGTFYLTSMEFSGMSDPDKVRAFARDVLDTINASTDAVSDGFMPVEVDAVEKVLEDGQRITTGFRSVPVRFALRKTPTPYSDAPPAAEIASLAQNDDRVAKALRILRTRERDWVNLYKVLEVIADDVGGTHELDRTGWAPRGDVPRFTGTANNARIVGDAARHAHERWDPPEHPMSLVEAESFMRQLLHHWLRLKVEHRKSRLD